MNQNNQFINLNNKADLKFVILAITLSILLIQPFVFCNGAKAGSGAFKGFKFQASQKTQRASSQNIAVTNSHAKPTKQSLEAEADENLKNSLVEQLIKNSPHGASQFNWLLLWKYLQDTVSPEGFLEAVRNCDETTVTSLRDKILEEDTEHRFGESIDGRNNVVIHIFSAILS